MNPASERSRASTVLPRIILLAGLLASGACGPGGSADGSAASPTPPSSWAFTCPDGLRLTAHLRADEIRLELPERQLVLPPVPAASGSRWQSGDTLFWSRGTEARLEVGGEVREGCRGERAASPEAAAALLGFEFRGVGQEPGWMVDVDPDRQVRWVGDYGVVRFATGAPERVEEEGGAWTWRAGSGEERVAVSARPEPCRDAMSGERYTHTVEVTVGDATYDGCGRELTRSAAAAPATPSPGRSLPG